jgi:hypothetical protein
LKTSKENFAVDEETTHGVLAYEDQWDLWLKVSDLTRSIPGFWCGVFPGAFLERALLKPDKSVPAIEERPEADHDLAPWDEADLKRLGLKAEDVATEDEAGKSSSRKPFRV